jgi:hypothetical protein
LVDLPAAAHHLCILAAARQIDGDRHCSAAIAKQNEIKVKWCAECDEVFSIKSSNFVAAHTTTY